MRIYIITIFPEYFECFKNYGIVSKAIKQGKVKIETINLRDFARDKHRTVDDVVYGGGPGMLLKPEPIFEAVDYIKSSGASPYTVITEPWGKKFDQNMAVELAKKDEILIICGRYEGVDERVKVLVDEEISVGDFILSGGEPAALVMIDSIVRLLPEVLSDETSIKVDSFSDGLVGYSNYTRPAEYRGMKVPDVLLSGNHKLIELYRRWDKLYKTSTKRPELLEKANLSQNDRKMLNYIKSGKSFEDFLREENLG